MKYLDNVYDGRWRVIKRIKPTKNNRQAKYELQNIYNERIITIDGRTLKKIDIGETTVCKVMAHNLFHNDLKKKLSSR